MNSFTIHCPYVCCIANYFSDGSQIFQNHACSKKQKECGKNLALCPQSDQDCGRNGSTAYPPMSHQLSQDRKLECCSRKHEQQQTNYEKETRKKIQIRNRVEGVA